MNPGAALDNLLDQYAPPAVRRWIHVAILVAGIVVTAILAAGGDWKQGLLSLAVALYAAANKANTTATPLDPAGVDSEPDDDESYDEAGGAAFPATHAEDAGSEADDPSVSGNLS